jgi:CBS domain-containing protein
MTGHVIVTHPEASIVEAARLMVDNDVSGLPVVENHQLVGIVTETDLISSEISVEAPVYFSFLDAVFRLPWDQSDREVKHVLATTVGQLMSRPVYTIRSDATLRDVATLIYERRISPIPVVDGDGRVLGVVSRSDLLRVIVESERSSEGGSGGGRA